MIQGSRIKIFISIIAILLVTNLVLLVFLLRLNNQIAPKKRLGFSDKLKNEVGFTPEQLTIYEPKRKAFWKRVRERFDEIKKTKEEFYYLMYDSSVPDSVLESRADVIGNQQKELDLQFIRHFKDIRSLCNPDQLQKYDSLLPPLIERMTARPVSK